MCLSCGISHRSRFIPLMFKSELLSPDYTEASTATEASVRLLRLLRLSSVVSNLSLMRFANDYIPTRLLTDAYTELLELRGAGGPRTPRFWLTIFEPGWQIMPIILLTARQIFSHTYDPAMP